MWPLTRDGGYKGAGDRSCPYLKLSLYKSLKYQILIYFNLPPRSIPGLEAKEWPYIEVKLGSVKLGVIGVIDVIVDWTDLFLTKPSGQ